MAKIYKRPIEEITRYHEFRRPDGAGWLEEDEDLSTGTVTVTDATGAVQAAMVGSAAVYGTSQIKYRLVGGTAGEYTVTLYATTTEGQKLEDTLTLIVL